MNPISELILHHDIELKTQELAQSSEDFLFISRVVDGEFLIEDAAFAVEKAHIGSPKPKCIILAAKKFSNISQNKLLKILEEPPKGVIFKLITPTKTTILPTILSRLPINNCLIKPSFEQIDIKSFGLEYIYNTLQQNRSLKPFEAKQIIELLSVQAFKSKDFNFSDSDYESLQECIKLLDLGSPAVVVLNSALLILLEVKTNSLKANSADKKS